MCVMQPKKEISASCLRVAFISQMNLVGHDNETGRRRIVTDKARPLTVACSLLNGKRENDKMKMKMKKRKKDKEILLFHFDDVCLRNNTQTYGGGVAPSVC